MADYTNLSINSGQYNDLMDSVDSTKTNKLLLDNISKIYNYKDLIELPMTFLRKYENIFKSNLVEMDLNKKYYYRPEYLSNEVFGTTDLWYLILFVNDMKSEKEFCTEKIKVPVSNYIMEIINKIKVIEEDVYSSQKEAIPVDRHLLKDVNFSSDEVIKISNGFRKKSLKEFEKFNFSGTNHNFLSSIEYYLTNDNIKRSDNILNEPCLKNCLNIFSEGKLPVSVISLPSNFENIKFDYSKDYYNSRRLEEDVNYVALKTYNGISNLSLEYIEDKNFKMDILTNEEMKFNRNIITCDMRELSEVHEEYDTNNKKIEIWTTPNFNGEVMTGHSNFDMLEFSTNFGGCVLSTNTFPDTTPNEEVSLFTISVNITEKQIKDFDFLGFTLYYICRFDPSAFDCYSICPLSITYIYDEIDENNKNIEKEITFSLPYKNKEYNTGESSSYDEESNSYNSVECINRILPIIKNCETKEKLNIKKIKVSFKYKNASQMNNSDFINIGIGGLKINGFKYSEIAREFQIPNFMNTDIYKFKYNYLYKNKYNGFYYELPIFKRNEDILELLSDENNKEIFTSKEYYSYDVYKIYFDSMLSTYDNDFRNYFNGLKNSPFFKEYTINNFHLDKSFKLEFKITFSSENIKNFGVKFNIHNNEGYYFHLSNYIENDNHFNIIDGNIVLKTGLYRLLNKNFSKQTKIFKNIEELNHRYHIIKTADNKIIEESKIFDNDTKHIKIRIVKNDNMIDILYAINDENEFKSLFSLTDYFYSYNENEDNSLTFVIYNNEVYLSNLSYYYCNEN